jgi:hypothetical protein
MPAALILAIASAIAAVRALHPIPIRIPHTSRRDRKHALTRIRHPTACLAAITAVLASAAPAQPAPPVAHPQAAHHLQLPMKHEPYTWRLPDGTVLVRGLTDAQGRAPVKATPGQTAYVLEMLWGEFPMQVPGACWQGSAAAFRDCVRIGERRDTADQLAEQRQDDAQRREQDRVRQQRVAWALRALAPASPRQIVAQALQDQRRWMRTPAAGTALNAWTCRTLTLAPPSPRAQATFERAAKLRGAEADLAYAEAAALGHWRAAARLATRMLEDEDWESAQAVVAWLLRQNVPAGHNRLADLIGTSDAGSLQLATALRWRAAQAGDPVAQSLMARHFADAGKPDVARALQACARRQNPAL